MKTKKQFTKQLLSIFLCVAMIMAYVPSFSLTAFAMETQTPTIIDNTIYANGTPITIEAGTNNSTSVWYMNGGKKTYIVENEDLSHYTIFGGANEKALDSNTSVTMTGGTVNRIYGGSNYANINGSIYVHILGGKVDYGVFGAGLYKSSEVSGTITMVVTGGSIKYVVGGANSAAISYSGKTYGYFTDKVPSLSMSNMGAGSFSNLIYRSGSAWLVKGSATVPEGIAMTIASDETMTLDYGEKVTINGSLINNGTIILKSKGLLGHTVTGSGQILRAVPYISAESVDSLRVWVNGEEKYVSADDYEILDGKVYLYLPEGKIVAELNGQNYYGEYTGDAIELQSGTLS